MSQALTRWIVRALVVASIAVLGMSGAVSAGPQAAPAVSGQAAAPAAAPAAKDMLPCTTPSPAAPGDKPAAPATPPRPAPVVSPEQKAYDEANKIEDPVKKLAEFRRIIAEYPKSPFVRQIDSSVFNTVMSLPALPTRTKEVAEAFDKVVANIAPASTPDMKLLLVASPVERLLDKNIVIDAAEKAVSDAMAGFDREKFAATQRDTATRLKQPEPTKEQIDQRFAESRSRGYEVLGRIHQAKGDTVRAKGEFEQALSANPMLTTAPIALAEIESAAGYDAAAINYYVLAGVTGKLKAANLATLKTLYRKVHGSETGLDLAFDRMYEERFKNPAVPTKWSPTAARSTRLVLAEMFTGSGCPPCVAADLALDAALERYPADAMTTIVYHVHIPQPDPMTTAGSSARKTYYEVRGVPTFNIDGALAKLGGGGREGATGVYNDYVKTIDKALEAPPCATISVRAVPNGDKISVTAELSKVAPAMRDLRLHIVLAERELKFSGENGMRFHPLVVRGVAGDANPGLPVTLDAKGQATMQYTFDLAAIRADIVKSLAEEMVKRRETETKAAAALPKGSTPAPPREYRAEGNAMTTINVADLVVVAFLQDSAKQVLQAARVDVSPLASKVGGGR